MPIDSRIPDAPGIYLVCLDGRPYYVGASINIRKRLRQHIARATDVGRLLASPRSSAHVLEIVRDASKLNAAEVKWAHRLVYGQVVYPHRSWPRPEAKQ